METRAIHADEALADAHAVAAPLYQTSTFKASDALEFAAMASVPMHERFYTRYGNPTRAQAEAVVAALDGAERAMLFASGMAAMTTAILACVRHGERIVAQRQLYPGVGGFLQRAPEWFGIDVAFVDQADTDAFAREIDARTKLVVLESPSNPLLGITDLPAVAALARSHGALTIVDNTLASPINAQPLALGIDLVMYSATKYHGGHSDLIAGAISGSNDLIERIWHASVLLGSALAPFEAWLALRGMRTLPLRMKQHNANAQAVAEFLATHPAIDRVNYPGLPSHPQHDLARAQMTGFGGLLSFRFKGGYAAADAFVGKLRHAARAPSLGGVETLVTHPASMFAAYESEEVLAQRGIDAGLVRLACGIESTRDLLADVEQALPA